ncbi:MAG: hypothetical protein RR719_04815, partial [Akkermansia sp.]
LLMCKTASVSLVALVDTRMADAENKICLVRIKKCPQEIEGIFYGGITFPYGLYLIFGRLFFGEI